MTLLVGQVLQVNSMEVKFLIRIIYAWPNGEQFMGYEA